MDRMESDLSIVKPVSGGAIEGVTARPVALPAKGQIKRYILTSAQNNTDVNGHLWKNLLVLAKYYRAEILVGTYSYNQNAYGKLAVKQGRAKKTGPSLWFDPCLQDYLRDERIELANGLVWCGEMNILPTALDPLSGLETYAHRKSAIFPHAKLAMRSIATMKGEGAKINYATGTVTLMNYIQKKEGLKAEHQHTYAFLVVEVNSDGNWWVRQVGAARGGRQIQDLNVVVEDGALHRLSPVEAITWGDLHATISDASTIDASIDMLYALKPRTQFLHDVLEGVTINHHSAKDPHIRFKNHLRGLNVLSEELKASMTVVKRYLRPGTRTVVVDSNHDSAWILRWLREHDYRTDPANAILFLEVQLAVYKAIERGNSDFHVLDWAMRKFGIDPTVYFLRQDQSYTICNKKIECGMHGHLGPNGARGNPRNLNRIGRRANTAHTHSAGIFNGLYVAGTSSRLDWDYAKGPSSWTHSHIVTYPNGQRTIITLYAGKWRAA